MPGSEADKRAQRKLAKEYADGCAERSGYLLPYMTTPNTVRDIDVIRAALGEKKLNYLGVSYGTYIGAVYGTLFPTHVRRLIVDSVVNPAQSNIWYQANLEQDIAFEGRFKDWESWVAKHDSVFHLGTTQAKVQQGWEKLRASAKRKPIGGLVGPAELIGWFQKAAYYDSSWVPVADTWSKYLAGDEKPLVEAADPNMADKAGNIASENGNAVYTAVECADAKWPTSWAKWDRDNTRIDKQAPFMTWSNAWMNLPCATWKAPQQTPVEVTTHKGLPKTLIVQSTRDAATPLRGRRRAAQALPRLGADHRAGRRFPRRHRSGQPLHQREGRRLPAHRQDRRLGRDVRRARHPGAAEGRLTPPARPYHPPRPPVRSDGGGADRYPGEYAFPCANIVVDPSNPLCPSGRLPVKGSAMHSVRRLVRQYVLAPGAAAVTLSGSFFAPRRTRRRGLAARHSRLRRRGGRPRQSEPRPDQQGMGPRRERLSSATTGTPPAGSSSSTARRT
ncbi:hypothetical protein GCM10020000_08670 [Streptomyces olivoverticillatus]